MLEKMNQTVMHSYPGMVALVTAKFGEKQNIMAAGWHSYISYDPPIYGVSIAKERYTYDLIVKSKAFAINFVSAEHVHYIQHCGITSGRDTDKFSELGIKTQTGKTISAPILREAYVAYECQVEKIIPLGDHDWIAGNITQFYKDERRFSSNGLPDFNEVSIPLYLGRSKYHLLNNQGKIVDLYPKD
jgi:flavin reductase (DIM6/NTAB) family NADH-FMN oxidoreductase RutF